MKILSREEKKVILLGNEAIARQAIESGVEFVSAYPGTPASEIGDTFYEIQNSEFKIYNLHFEYSTNEKVAMEAAGGAAFCGAKSLVAMKNFGLNVASDFLMPLVYTGIRGAMVIAVADDSSCWSSAQSEQNSRAFSYLAHIPILEPSNPQECKDFTKLAFEISEKFKIPVMVRETTRVALQSMPVLLGKIVEEKREKREFIKNPHQFSTMPPRVLEMKSELLERIEEIREISENSEINQILNGGSSDFGIITSGISHLYVMEALKELNLDLPILKLGFFYPLPEKKIADFIKNLKKVLIAEELDPYLEKEIKILAKDVNPQLEIYGKSHLPEVGELKPEHLLDAISQISKKYLVFNPEKHLEKFLELGFTKRLPQFCPGCPYWLVVAAIKKAVDLREVILGGEIGCYMLLSYPPYNLQDYLYCMGSSVGVAHGIKKANPAQKLISFVGDASFFHAGIPALINVVHNKSNPLIIILDNGTTAMTGQQPHPGVERTGMGEKTYKIEIEDVCRVCGVKNIKVIDPVNQQEFIETVRNFLELNEVSVIIARHPCARLK